jgi:hypothetical protein
LADRWLLSTVSSNPNFTPGQSTVKYSSTRYSFTLRRHHSPLQQSELQPPVFLLLQDDATRSISCCISGTDGRVTRFKQGGAQCHTHTHTHWIKFKFHTSVENTTFPWIPTTHQRQLHLFAHCHVRRPWPAPQWQQQPLSSPTGSHLDQTAAPTATVTVVSSADFAQHNTTQTPPAATSIAVQSVKSITSVWIRDAIAQRVSSGRCQRQRCDCRRRGQQR